MFQAVKRAIAQRALVRPRDLALVHVERRLEARADRRVVRVQPASDRVRRRESREAIVGTRGVFGHGRYRVSVFVRSSDGIGIVAAAVTD